MKKKSMGYYSGGSSCNSYWMIFPVLIFLAALAWLLNDFGYMAFNMPWFTIIVFLFSLEYLLKCLKK